VYISFDILQINLIEESMEKQTPSKAANYKHSQIFGYKGPNERILDEDIISRIRYDSTGNYIALGDKAGRIIIFYNQGEQKQKSEPYEYYTEFQSHTREFDPLKSMEVPEEIVDMHWLAPQGKYLKLVTTNSRNMKIWKLFEKTQKKVVKTAGHDLNMPRLQNTETNYVAELQHSFPSKHLSMINSTSASSN